ncbi:MAG: hypothetical protein ABDH59_00440 [Fervidobacterium sp.]
MIRSCQLVFILLVLLALAPLSLSTFAQTTSQTEDILVLFNSRGLLYTTIDKEFEVPDGWNVLHISSPRWYVENNTIQPEYLIPANLPEGKYKIIGNIATSDNGEKYTQTPFGLAKILNEGKTSSVIKLTEKSDALFSVPGGYRIYYTLKETILEQFFEIKSPVDKAYVILSTAPEENIVRTSYSKMALETISEEVTTAGRKIFILGYQEGLRKGINIRNKTLSITRQDWNKIYLNYNYTYAWQPADYVVEIKTTDELPAGEIIVYSNILGKNVPIGITSIPDINKEGEIYISKSWQVYHSWVLTKMTKASGRTFIAGELNLKGNGLAKLIIQGRNISGLSISLGNIIKTASDYVEIQIPVSKVVKVNISFTYTE